MFGFFDGFLSKIIYFYLICTFFSCSWTQYAEQNILPTVKHGGGLVMLWVCFASGTGNLQCVESKTDSIKKKYLLSVMKLKLGRHSTFQKDNDPKHHQGMDSEKDLDLAFLT